MSEDFGPVPSRPKSWEDVFAVTKGLLGVAIEEIERGRVDWEYQFDTKDMRSCGRKGCEQKHAHGWLVALSGQRFVNIGKDCAKNYAHTGLWSSNISAYKERRNSEARTTALINARDKAQLKQYWLDNMPEIDAAIRIYDSFLLQAQGSFLREIERRAERGEFVIERERRLSEDELQVRRAMLSGARVEGEPGPYIAAVEKVTVGTIEGLECFRPQGSPRQLKAQLQRLVTTLLAWSPASDDLNAQRSLVRATSELAPLSNRLNSSHVAVNRFFSESNLKQLMLLDVIRSQGITAIELNSDMGVVITRRPNWHRAA